MYRMIGRVLCALSLCAVIAGLSRPATGEVSSRFAASYRLSSVVESGNHVDMTIKLTLFNPTNSDIKGGIVVLYDSQPNRSLLGSFGAIKSLPHLGQATTSESFTISAEEYAHWQQGRDPVLEFLAPNSGAAAAVGIQAHRVRNPGESIN